MAGGGQGSRPTHHFVERALVGGSLLIAGGFFKRNEVHHWQLAEELFRATAGKLVSLVVPPAALEEEPINVTTEFRFFFDLGMMREVVKESKPEIELVDGDGFLAGIVLKASRDEGLGEEESAHPEGDWGARFDPGIQEEDPHPQVLDPAPQRFEAQESLVCPNLADLVVVNAVAKLLKVLAHDHETLEGLLEVKERALHDLDEPVVPDELLHQDSVHGLVVVGRILLHDLLDVEEIGGFGFNSLGDFKYDVFSCLSARGCLPGLD